MVGIRHADAPEMDAPWSCELFSKRSSVREAETLPRQAPTFSESTLIGPVDYHLSTNPCYQKNSNVDVIFFPRHRQDIRIQFHDDKVFWPETLSESLPNITESLTITIREEEQYLRHPCSVFYLGTGQLSIRSTRVSVALLKEYKVVSEGRRS